MLLLLPLILNTIGASSAWEPDLRIVGGYPIRITERPYQIILYRVTRREAIPDCGGSIITRRWILTAAHCVYGVSPEYLFIRAGTDDLDDDRTMLWYEIGRVIPHEHFDPISDSAQNDIALLMTKVEIDFFWKVQPVKLSRKSPKPDSDALISGFGVTREGSLIMSRILIEVSVTVLDRHECIDLLADVSSDLSVSATHFCAAHLEGGRDACQGDSGGPVTIDDTLVGIVSWGVGCATEMVPAFYTDVSLFLPWIDAKIRKYSGKNHKIVRPNYRE